MKIERERERERKKRWEDSLKVSFVGDFKRKRYSYSPYDVINVYDYRSNTCHRIEIVIVNKAYLLLFESI